MRFGYFVIAAGLATGGLFGQAYTNPKGYYTVKVAGTPEGVSQARTYLGIQLLPEDQFVGMVTSVNGKALTLGNLSSHEVLEDPDRESYLHIRTGTGAGFIASIEDFRATDILTTSELAPWIQPGNQIVIRPHSAISDIFGTTNRFGLASGSGADSADNVVFWDAETQQERIYYFHSTRSRWEEKDIEADAGLALVRFPYGLYIVRRSPGNLRIVLSGSIDSGNILLPVKNGANVFSLPVNLSSSLQNLIATEGEFSVRKGPNTNRADLLVFEESATGTQKGPFYFLSRPETESWREVGENSGDLSEQPLDFLSTLILRRNGPPGYVLAKASLEPSTFPPTPPGNAEPGEIPLTAEIEFPSRFTPRPDVSYTVETSANLETWQATPPYLFRTGNRLTFQLP